MCCFFQTILDFLHRLFWGNNEQIFPDRDDDEIDDSIDVEEPEVDNSVEDEGSDSEDVDIPTEEEPTPEEPMPEEPGHVCAGSGKIKILIDNGHGSDTPGKRSPYSSHNVPPEIEFYEYKWAREIARAIVGQLVVKGFNAELLVPEENDVPLKDRVSRANKFCDEFGKSNVILISIHSNASGMGNEWKSARGWCAYTSVGQTRADEIAESLYKEAEKNFVGMKIRMDKTDGDSDIESNFYILKNTKCPAVLTENFFYDNVEDVEYILSQEGRDAVIKTHVDGLINYICNC